VVIPKQQAATVLSALPLEAVKGVPFELKYELETRFPLAAGEIDWDADLRLNSAPWRTCPVGAMVVSSHVLFPKRQETSESG
jgi:hypothetical protein